MENGLLVGLKISWLTGIVQKDVRQRILPTDSPCCLKYGQIVVWTISDNEWMKLLSLDLISVYRIIWEATSTSVIFRLLTSCTDGEDSCRNHCSSIRCARKDNENRSKKADWCGRLVEVVFKKYSSYLKHTYIKDVVPCMCIMCIFSKFISSLSSLNLL